MMGILFFVEIVFPNSGRTTFEAAMFDPNIGDSYYYIIKSTGTPWTETDYITSPTVYKFVFHNTLPIYNTRGFIMTDLNTSVMHLDPKSSVYLFETAGYGYMSGNFHIPPMTDGRTIHIVDTAGMMDHTSINLISNTPQPSELSESNVVEGQIIKNYAANWLSRVLVYIGDGTVGSLVCIESSISQ